MTYTKPSIRSNPSQSSFIDKLMVDRRAGEIGEPGSICHWLLSAKGSCEPPSSIGGRVETPPVTPALRHAPDPALTTPSPAPPPLWMNHPRVNAANQEAADAARNWQDHVSWEWPSDLSKDHPPGFEYGPKHKRLNA
jgi:hypothetical protein